MKNWKKVSLLLLFVIAIFKKWETNTFLNPLNENMSQNLVILKISISEIIHCTNPSYGLLYFHLAKLKLIHCETIFQILNPVWFGFASCECIYSTFLSYQAWFFKYSWYFCNAIICCLIPEQFSFPVKTKRNLNSGFSSYYWYRKRLFFQTVSCIQASKKRECNRETKQNNH